MVSIKQYLTFLSVLTITTPIINLVNTTTVSDNKQKYNDIANVAASIDQRVKKDLGLINDKGKGTQSVTMAANHNSWEIPILNNPVTAATLLKEDRTAKSKNSYNFITQTLGVKPESEAVWTNAKFRKADLIVYKGVITDLKPFLTPTKAKDDYAVTNGSYRFQFKKDDVLVGGKVLVPVQIAPENGLFGTQISYITKAIKVEDTNVVKLFDFQIGGTAPSLEFMQNDVNLVLQGRNWAIHDLIQVGRLMLSSVGEWPRFVTKDAVIDKSGKWAKGNSLTFHVTTETIAFAATTTFIL